jgi:hypothetical protein
MAGRSSCWSRAVIASRYSAHSSSSSSAKAIAASGSSAVQK